MKFSKPVQLDDGSGCAVNPMLVVNGSGNVHLSWEANGNTVLFTRSTALGQTFAKAAQAATGINVNGQRFAVGPNSQIALVYDAAALRARPIRCSSHNR
jgi:hypothetical protein